MVSMTSVELTDARDSPNLTLERAWNKSWFVVNLNLTYFKLFLIAWNARNKLTPIISCLKLLPLSSVVFIMSGSSLTLISHFFLIFENFQNTYLTLNIHISAKWQPKIKINISKFKLAHWQFKPIWILKIPLLLFILCLIKQEYFFGSPGRKTNFCISVPDQQIFS